MISLVLCGKQFNFLRSVSALRKLSGDGDSRDRATREFSLESGSIVFNSELNSQNFGDSSFLEKETMKRLINKDLNKKIRSIIESENKDLMVQLALTTLSSFDFRDFNESLTHFFDEIVLTYLNNGNDEVREAAVKTCSSLTVTNDRTRIGSLLEKILKKLLKKFLMVATADKNHSIRCNMLRSLSSQFDCYLSSKENLILLFNCMKDPSFEIREKTLRILGRLADNNKGILYPYLRNLLVTVMSTIEYKSDPKEKEEAIKILKTFIKKCKRVVKDHIECLLKSLLSRMQDEDFNYSLLPDIIETIGQLSTIDGAPIIPYLDELIPLILDCVKDEISARKREIGLKVFIMVIENTGYVIKPYFHYPETIHLLQVLIQNESTLRIRKLVYKLLGTMGALDPYLIRQIMTYISEKADRDLLLNIPLLSEIDKLKKFSNDSTIKNLNKHVLVASKEIDKEVDKVKGISGSTGVPLEHLGNILMNPTLRDIHKTVLESIDFIFNKVKEHTKSYLHLLFPPLQSLIKTTNDEALRKHALKSMQKLIF